MYLTLSNGEREVFDGFWKSSSRYLINKSERRVERWTWIDGVTIGFIVGLILTLILTNVLKLS
jgi:hypothetical protein